MDTVRFLITSLCVDLRESSSYYVFTFPCKLTEKIDTSSINVSYPIKLF